MSKEIESMNERELLEELVRQGKKRETLEKIKLFSIVALLAAIVVLAAVYIPKILTPLHDLSQSMQAVEQAAAEAERVLAGFDEKTMDQLRQTLESLDESSQEIRVLADTLMDSGFGDLKTTIESLTESLGSLSSLLRIFGR